MATLRWLRQLMSDVLAQHRRDRVPDLAASITFWTVLSIPAAVLALVSALGPLEQLLGTSVIDDLRLRVDDFVETTFLDSQPLQDTVDDLFTADQSRVLTFTTVFAVFTLSRSFAAMIRSLDVVYSVDEHRSWWHVRLVAIGLGLGSIAAIAGAASLLATTSAAAGSAERLLLAAVTILGLAAWAAMVFHVGPNHRTPWRYDLPGAVFTAIGWTVATQLFALYIRLAPQGNQVQSTIGALLLGITLLYVLGVVMLIGAEINDILTRRADVARPQTTLREHVDTALDHLDRAVDKVTDRRSPADDDRDDPTPVG